LKFALRWLIEWFAALTLWVCFTFSFSVDELLIGAASATLAVVALEAAFRAEPLCFHPTLEMMAQVRKLPLLIVRGLWALASVLWSRMSGGRSQSGFRIVHFNAAGTDPKKAAKRALVVSFSTTPPNSIIVDVDLEKNQMLMHQVKRTALPEVIRNLEAAR
jgi:multisubunit Na+/H+ antiporter MnhE subunit